MYVNIEADHVQRGVRHSPSQCPTALALLEKEDVDEVLVAKTQVVVKRNGRFSIYRMPGSLRQATARFDQQGEMEPGRYRLRLQTWRA